jgi:hypothetical protein
MMIQVPQIYFRAVCYVLLNARIIHETQEVVRFICYRETKKGGQRPPF